MTKISQIALCAIMTSSFAAPSYALCSLTGKWHSVAVAAGTNNQVGAGTLSVGCRLTIKTNGQMTGTCVSQSLGQPAVSTVMSGTLKTDAKCEISGVWKAPGFQDSIVIAGFAKDDLAIFAAVRGDPPFQVRSVSMIRE
jgi:hypothetical protein